MAKFNKISLVACLLCVVLCASLLLTACHDEPPTTVAPTTTVGTTNYTISVKTAGGMLLDNVTVYVRESATNNDLVDIPKKLDSEGKYKFTAPTSDKYVVELEGVPAGYDVQAQYALTSDTLDIVLTSAPIAGNDPTGTNYYLGDIIRDFSVTAPDGTVYTISEILKEKNAVVLNFWYTNCGPCKQEFPDLQEAYEKYGDKVEVLALNTEKGETNSKITEFKGKYGLTFPMVLADNAWVQAFQIVGYPTTIVIDRYGMICYRYDGGITDPAVFPALLRHFSEEEYTQDIVTNAEDLITQQDIPYGCEKYPYEVGAVEEFVGEVRADELVHYTLYRISSATLRIEDPDVYLVWEGNTYYPTDGVLEMEFPATEDFFSGVSVQLGTTGGVDKQVILKQVPRAGSSENPLVLERGEVVFVGNGMDMFYSFTADFTGTFTLTLDPLPEGVTCRANITNMRTYTVTDAVSTDHTDPATGKITFTISVEAGDTLRIIFGAYGAITDPIEIHALASIPEGEGIGASEYCISVKDETGNPIANVMLTIHVNGTDIPCITDANGEARMELNAGTYPVNLVVPEGYFATTQYLLTPAKKTLDIVLVPEREYTVRVSVTGSAVTSVIRVNVYTDNSLCELICSTELDENGEIKFPYGHIDGCVAVLEGLPSSVLTQSSYPLTGDVTQIDLINTSIGDTNASGQDYHLGDTMNDFSITTPDGRVYALYELLQEKKMVLLTFWHSNDTNSVSCFNHLQSVYDAYSDRIEILAMNPLDKSDLTISQFQGANDFSFPMAQCSAQWESAIHLTMYPTMVLIDRNGTVCLINPGHIADQDTLKLVLDYYTAEDYETTTANNVQELLQQINQPAGTETDPIVVEQGTMQLEKSVKAGQQMYLLFRELEPLGIRVEGEGIYVIYNGVTYESVNGVIELEINTSGTQNEEMLIIGNSGDEKVMFRLTLTRLAAG